MRLKRNIQQSQSNMSVRDNYGSVVRLKSIKSNNLSMMLVRDRAVSVRLKRNIQQSVHHVNERYGSVGETEEKYPTICPPCG